jgi:hypothetical protein
MRRIMLLIFAGLLTFSVGTFFIVRSFQSRSRLTTPPVTIPDNWKKIDLDAFSFYAPPDLKNQNVHGIDSAVWEFRTSSMTLNIDYGMYSNDLKFYEDQPEYQAKWYLIGGKSAKVATLRLSDEYAADHLHKDQKYVAAVYFPDVASSGTKLTFWAECVDTTTQESAKKILQSIKFK